MKRKKVPSQFGSFEAKKRQTHKKRGMREDEKVNGPNCTKKKARGGGWKRELP